MKYDMTHPLSIGDIVQVVNSGQTYNLYVSAAMLLGADVDPNDLDTYNPDQSNRHKFKFKTGDSPENGELGFVKNIANQRYTTYYLFERLNDYQQFVMGRSGIMLHQKVFFKCDDSLFEL